MNNKTTRFLIFSGFIGPIIYFTLLSVLGLLWEGYDPISTGMSEIGAVDSPYRNVMNYFGFSLLGLWILAFSFGFKAYFNKHLSINIAFILLLTGGTSMFLVGFFPCDAQCIDVTIVGHLHSISSTVPAIMMPVAAMVSADFISRVWGKLWGYISFYLGLLSMASGPMMFIARFNSFSGLIQRLGMGFSLFWMVLISLHALRKMRVL
ncbi:MAG: DUF998 domain-containing protein [Chlamydiota bacterium]|nr:DUF998 domain-containing protein [Chlamydiota bacterium]